MGDMTQLLQGLRAMLFVTAALVVVRRHRTAASLARLRPAALAASLLLLLLSAGTTLAMVELGLRMAHYPFRGTWTPSETAMARYDAELGWAYVPGRRVTQRYGTDPRPVTATFDSLGIRVERADHVWRARDPSVLFIGDSFTMGHGVGADEAFPARVEAFLGKRIQAVNLGVEGYGTDQALLSLRRYIDRFQTRAVVYTFIADHVWRNDNYDRRVYYPDGNWPGSKPLFGLRGDGGVVLRKPPMPVSRARRPAPGPGGAGGLDPLGPAARCRGSPRRWSGRWIGTARRRACGCWWSTGRSPRAGRTWRCCAAPAPRCWT